MPQYPYTFSSKGRAYYGSILEANNRFQPTYYTGEEQREVVSTTQALSNTSKFALGLTALGGLGFLPYKNGTIWDKYVQGFRTAEEYSPGGILKTFQLSNIFSPLESVNRQANLFISPELLAGNKVYTDYLTRLIGESSTSSPFTRLLQEGTTLKQGKLFYGQGSDVALQYAGAIRASTASRFGEGYARALNVNRDNLHSFFSSIEPRSGISNPAIAGLPVQIIGGQTRGQAAYRFSAGIGTELVERFNRLLDLPIETRPLSDIFGALQKGLQSSFGKKLHFGVNKTGGLRMLGALAMKYGPGLTAVTLGYQTLDYSIRNASLFNNTAFNEGLTSGVATLGVKANLALSRAAESTGLSDYREKQEEVAPGSTSLQKLLAFPIIGATSVGIAGYGYRVAKILQLQKNGMDVVTASKVAIEAMQDWSSFSLKQLGHELTSKNGLWSRDDLLGKLIQKVATPNKEGDLIYKFIGKLTPTKAAAGLAGAIGLGLTLPFLPGALIPSQRPDELEAIYSGKQDIAIRKGRWWTFGRSKYEGEKALAHIPHWYPRLMQRFRDKAIWNEQEGEELSPLKKYLKREFTYDLEVQHYYDRPYPITSLPFQDVPLIGPVLANTLGRLIKPPKLMHTPEWINQQGQTLVPAGRKGERVATELGEIPGGQPISPYSIQGTVGEQISNLSEMVGLPGFISSVIKEKITGSQDFFDQKAQLESARRIAGTERNYWERELGDIGATNEALRRLFPHRRRQIDLYNPIKNTMPSWMPGAGDKSTDFLTGDPYSKIQFGELRLPGRGYEERYPELKGIAPEDYPLIHQFKILGDIAPYSEKYGHVTERIRAQRKYPSWTEQEENLYQQTIQQLKEKKQGQEFQEYQYISQGHKEESSSLMATINQWQASKVEKPSLFRKFFGGYWELLSHNAETALDQLTPLSPAAKFIHQRSAIEAYERQQVYGTKNAFWEHPVRDFIAPFSRLMGKALGYEAIPQHLQDVRNINEYFDTLKYVKFTRLANIARADKDFQAVKEFETKKDQTLFGMNPFTMNFTNIFTALPRSDRDYYNQFAETETIEEREKILKLVPENEKAMYVARWKLAYAQDIKKAKIAGILNDKQVEEADQELEKIYTEAGNEGFASSKEMTAEYISTRETGENYGDWYRRTKLLTQVSNIPGADWTGWHPSVDLEDIKMKVVETLGEDMHEFDLWPSRLKDLPYKPFLTEETIQPLLQPSQMSEDERRSRINELIGNKSTAFIMKSNLQNNSTQIDIEEDRSNDVRTSIRKYV